MTPPRDRDDQQAADQKDPTNAKEIKFVVVFSEPVATSPPAT